MEFSKQYTSEPISSSNYFWQGHQISCCRSIRKPVTINIPQWPIIHNGKCRDSSVTGYSQVDEVELEQLMV